MFTLTPEAAREKLSICTNAYQVAQICLELLGIDRDQAYQALPAMHQRTLRRITKAMPDGVGKGAWDTVRKYLFFGSKKEQIHVDSKEGGSPESPQEAPQLPAELAPLEEAALKAKVSLTVALKAVVRYANPVDDVLRRLTDMTRLQKHAIINNPTGFFTHLMRQGKEVELPAQELRCEAIPTLPMALKPSVRPIAIGDTLKYYGQLVKVVELSRQFCTVLCGDDELNNVTLEKALLLRV